MDWACEQIRRNAESASAWDLYATHRARVMRMLIEAAAEPDATLCLLGAGNLNDVDLAELFKRFQRITLTDLDAAAIELGIARQGLSADERIRIVAPADVTGLLGKLSALKPETPVTNEFATSCLQILRQRPQVLIGETFDVVGSVGLLTQLIDAVVKTVGESHPSFWALVEAVRRQHVHFLLDLAKPNGSALIVTELVSSDSCPELRTVGEDKLPDLLRQQIAQGNFFTGMNPAAWRLDLLSDEVVQARLASCEFTSPWLWNFVARKYAVFGVNMRLRSV